MKVHVILSKTFKKIQNYKFSYFYNVDFINNSILVRKKQRKTFQVKTVNCQNDLDAINGNRIEIFDVDANVKLRQRYDLPVNVLLIKMKENMLRVHA